MKHFLSFILCTGFLLFSACSTEVPEGFRNSRIPFSEPPVIRDVNIEVLILDEVGVPLEQCDVRVETEEFIDEEVSDSRGISNITIRRTGSERIRFSFTKENFTGEYIATSLPQHLTQLGMAFKVQRDGNIKLLSYTSDN